MLKKISFLLTAAVILINTAYFGGIRADDASYFDFSDSEWVSRNVGSEPFDETSSYGEKPYIMPTNDSTSLSFTNDGSNSFLRVSANRYAWILLRFANLAPEKYVKVIVRPSAQTDRMQFRWFFDPTNSENVYFDEIKPDTDGWYTIIRRVANTGQTSDIEKNSWGILVPSGYFDIKYAQCAEKFESETENESPVKSITINGADAFIDNDTKTASIDTALGFLPGTIGLLVESDIEITGATGNETITPVPESAHIQQTIAYVSSNICYDITKPDGTSERWTIKKISRNGNVFDMTDTHWVNAHMSNDIYKPKTTTVLPDGSPLIMRTSDSDECGTKLFNVSNGNSSALRVKPINSSTTNSVVIRLDKLSHNKYIKYVYKSEASNITPAWTSGAGYGAKVQNYDNIEICPGGLKEYTGNIGSCYTFKNSDLKNKAMMLSTTTNYSFDISYVACFDSEEEMTSYDPSIQSVVLGGEFAEIDHFAHTATFTKSAGSLSDVKISTYHASLKKYGGIYTYPSGATAQKYIATGENGGKTIWTIQLGDGECGEQTSVSTDGTVTFGEIPDAAQKFAALYKNNKIVDIRFAKDNKIAFNIPDGSGIYKLRTFAWSPAARPAAQSVTKTLSYGNIVILGDSYSTFTGYIPSDNSSWYTPSGNENTDVTDAAQTWWKILENSSPANKILLNESYSGTTVCNVGYGGADYSDISFTARFDKLADSGFFDKNTVDTLFVFGGTNDTWASSPVGEAKYSDWNSDDMNKSIPSFCYLLSRIRQVSPNTNVICILNTSLSSEIADGYIDACDYYGCEYIVLNKINKRGGHPTIKGMEQIAHQILDRAE